jgi:hypothetical protein
MLFIRHVASNFHQYECRGAISSIHEITKRIGADSSVSDNHFTITEDFIKDVKEAFLDPWL